MASKLLITFSLKVEKESLEIKLSVIFKDKNSNKKYFKDLELYDLEI